VFFVSFVVKLESPRAGLTNARQSDKVDPLNNNIRRHEK